MKQIPLSRGYVALVDDADYDHVVAAGKWSACVKPTAVYALRAVRRPDGRWTTTRLHNFVTGLPYVDHRNGNGLDNRRENLRAADKRTNGANTTVRRANNASGYKGVGWHKAARKWEAQIRANNQKFHLGLFVTPEAAALAYDAAARELFGEFARPNFPEVSAS